MIELIIIIIWVICGMLSYGHSFGFYQRNWPNIAERCCTQDQRFSVFMAFLGPVSLAISLIKNRPWHGFMFRRPRPPRIPTLADFLIPEKK